jgi:energy-coupling factor transporter ATP-binding protein EcfA2
MLRLVELHVRKYRDLVDGGPLRFGPGPVFLLGPNGSGKTTLLELIGVLLGDDLGPLFREEDAVELSWVLEAEGGGETPTTRLELDLSIDAVSRTRTDERTAKRTRRGWSINGVLPARSQNEQTLEFREFAGGSLSYRFGAQEISPEDSEAGSEVEQPGYLNTVCFHLGLAAAGHDLDATSYDRLYGITDRRTFRRLTRLDEALTQFDQIVGLHDESVELLEQPNIAVMPQELPNWVSSLTDGKTIDSTDHPDLTLLTHLLGADRVEFRPRLVSDDGRGRRRWRGFDIYVHWDGGAMHHHSELSFGQKRLIALIWRMGVGVNLPLLTDEMTNGLHAGWVRAIINHLGPRQGFHAVQNPLLLDRYGPGEQAEDIAGRFVICTVETAERGRQWRWRSPTPEECERLWQAYLAGFQHLSELLISEGLW